MESSSLPGRPPVDFKSDRCTFQSGSFVVPNTSPKGSNIVSTWASKGLLYHDFAAYVDTIAVLGPFGNPTVSDRHPA